MAIFFLKKEILVKKAENENPELEKREKAKKYEIIESIGKMREKINKESSLTSKYYLSINEKAVIKLLYFFIL